MASHGMEAGARSRAQFRLRQEVVDTHRRSLIGGVFYLAGWLVVGSFGGAFARELGASLLVAFAFALLAAARWLVKPPEDLSRGRRWLAWSWTILLATAVCWSGVTVWAHVDPGFAPAHHAMLVCTVGYATAVAHSIAIRRAVALPAIALLIGPSLLLHGQDPADRALAISLTLYLAYLVLALGRAHREWNEHVELDWALQEQRDSYERLSRLDALTGIANRRSFQDALGSAAERARANGGHLSLLMLDLDHFKHVNDRHGHVFGDECLATFAHVLERGFDGAFVARLGGEEFAVLLETDPGGARAEAERFRAALAERPLPVAERDVAMTVSIGVGHYDARRAQNLDEFVRNADRALYRAKTEGRNRVCDAGVGPVTH